MTGPHQGVRAADWRRRAQCREEDPELFFPFGPSGTVTNQTSQAKAVCKRCPVRAECLTWALETGQNCGVWGGLDEDELCASRRRAARRRKRESTDKSTPGRTTAPRPQSPQPTAPAVGTPG